MPVFFLIIFGLVVIAVFSFSYFKSHRIQKLIHDGRQVSARFVKQESSSFSRNDVSGNYIFVQGEDGVIYKSKRNFKIFSRSFLENHIFNVFINREDMEDYYVKIDFEPIHKRLAIPFVTEAKLRKQANIIKAKGVYVTKHVVKNKKGSDSRFFFIYVQEELGQKRIFKSNKLYRTPPLDWFQDKIFDVYVDPMDERKYFVDDQVPSIGETVLKGIGEIDEVINSYQNNSL